MIIPREHLDGADSTEMSTAEDVFVNVMVCSKSCFGSTSLVVLTSVSDRFLDLISGTPNPDEVKHDCRTHCD